MSVKPRLSSIANATTLIFAILRLHSMPILVTR